MASEHHTIRERFSDALRVVFDERDGRLSAPELAALRALGRELLASHAQLAALASLAPPLLRVRSDTLCVLVLGELDGVRAERSQEEVLACVLAHDIRHVVFDLTGASPTGDTPQQICRMVAALAAHGVRRTLSGVGTEIAVALRPHHEALVGVRSFGGLAEALAAAGPPHGR